jgi:hypothetical protein
MMRADVERSEWQTFLDGFGERNKTRPTRLEVISRSEGVSTDFWLEDGLALSGAVLDKDVEGAPHVEIMLDGCKLHDNRHLTRTVSRVRRLGYEESDGGRDDALEVEDEESNITILRFE